LAEKTVIAIFNSSSEVLELLREAMQSAGHATVVGHIDDLKRGRLDVIKFVEEHQPDCVVYDVAPPYDTNWTFLRLMISSKAMEGRALVVTTTNKRVLEELIGPSDVLELVGKPYDLEQICDAVALALRKRPKVANE
jgi:DNA-binding NarL/FixJ family response regulator